MEDLKVSILDAQQFTKNDKTYCLLKLYCSISDGVIKTFVNKSIYDRIETGVIDNDNIINYCHFKVDSNMIFHISIY